MSEKALQLALETIKDVYRFDFPEFSEEQINTLAQEALAAIDWNDPALMHKDLKWIARRFLKHKGIS